MNKVELVTRCGYRNFAKGIRRLDEVCAGDDLSRARYLLAKLPMALSVEPFVVERAIIDTQQAKQHEEDERYRNTFRPHAILRTDRSRPEPIFIALVLGVENILRINFAEGSAPISYMSQTLAAIRQRLANNASLPAFGRPIAFVVNYDPHFAVWFSLDGTPQVVLDRAVRISEGTLNLRGKALSRVAI